MPRDVRTGDDLARVLGVFGSSKRYKKLLRMDDDGKCNVSSRSRFRRR